MLAKSIVFFSDRSYTRSGGRNLFLRSDLDRDGSLPLLELAALLHSLGLRPAAGDEIHVLIAAMDTDGNDTM